jgi:hypothetical protein
VALETKSDLITRWIQAFRYGNPAERRTALGRLAQVGSAAADAIPDFIASLRDADLEIRTGAAEALVRMGSVAVTPLVEALLDEDVDFRRAVIHTLGRIGPDAAAAVPVLTTARADEQLAQAAEEALAAIGAPPTEVRSHLAATLPLALLITVVVGVLFAGLAALVHATGVLQPEHPLALTLGAIGAVLGGLLGLVIGGSQWGRAGMLPGLMVVGLVGYTLGTCVGGLAGSMLEPLVRAFNN